MQLKKRRELRLGTPQELVLHIMMVSLCFFKVQLQLVTKGTAARTHLTCLPWALSQVSQSSGARLSLLEATESLCHKHQ